MIYTVTVEIEVDSTKQQTEVLDIVEGEVANAIDDRSEPEIEMHIDSIKIKLLK